MQPQLGRQLLGPLPLPTLVRTGGNIAEIVYHVANGCLLIIAAIPERERTRGKRRERGV